MSSQYCRASDVVRLICAVDCTYRLGPSQSCSYSISVDRSKLREVLKVSHFGSSVSLNGANDAALRTSFRCSGVGAWVFVPLIA
jgi:hypothetical protein